MTHHLGRELLSRTVPPDYDGRMVKDFIRNNLGISRGLLRKIMSVHGVLVNGKQVFLTSRLRQGDLLQLIGPSEISEEILPEPIPFEVVYEDLDILIVNKRAGLVVHPVKGHFTGTLANGVVYHWQKNNEQVKFRAVHRIDRNTSGLLVIAKDPYSHQKLTNQLKTRQMKREYLAVVHGVIIEDQLSIDAPILEVPGQDARVTDQEGKHAITHVTVMERLQTATIIHLKLETGRTHQIRVHMKSTNHPLFGDELYGIGISDGIARQALHAEKLGFFHPRLGDWMEWNAPLPNDIKTLITNLRNG